MLKVSIAMCTYNGEMYLREQLDSIARQSRLPDELVICDDGSADMTIQIVDAFAESALFPVKLFKNSENIGSTQNFEQAIKLCQGDVIVLSDQDDLWHPDKLKLIEQVFMDSDDAGAVFSNGSVVSDNLSPLGYTLWDTFSFKDKQKSDFNAGRAFEVLLNRYVVTGATMAFRSRLRETIFPIPPAWLHDAWIAIVISTSHPIKFIDNCLIDYRQHDKQQIGGINKSRTEKIRLSKSIDSYHSQIQLYELLLEHLQQFAMVRKDYFIKKIREKISHLEIRSLIYRSSLLDKIIITTLELLKGRYHDYSKGFLSYCKDLFLIKIPR